MSDHVGVFGGSFDPVHNGHVIAAIQALEALQIDRLVVVPAHRSPHKPGGVSASPQDRLDLLHAAFGELPRCEVSDVEVRRPPPSYTIDTLDALWPKDCGTRVTLILGLDALADFPRWRAAADIARRCDLAVLHRPGFSLGSIEDARRSIPGLRVSPITMAEIGISATAVRARLSAGLPVLGFVPDAVRALIAARGLYRG